MHISLLTCSRGRPNGLKRLIETAQNLSSGKNRVSFENYIDFDDALYPQYAEEMKVFEGIENNITLGVPQSVSKSWNDLALGAIKNEAEILMMGNDDLIFHTQNWDEILIEETEKFPDQIYCMWFNDGINADRHCAFPIISSKWFHTVGHFTPGIFSFLYNDAWIFDIAKRIGRAHYIPHVSAEHLHFTVGKSEVDETTLRNRTGEKRYVVEEDKIIFNNTEIFRVGAADRLQSAISSFSS